MVCQAWETNKPCPLTSKKKAEADAERATKKAAALEAGAEKKWFLDEKRARKKEVVEPERARKREATELEKQRNADTKETKRQEKAAAAAKRGTKHKRTDDTDLDNDENQPPPIIPYTPDTPPAESASGRCPSRCIDLLRRTHPRKTPASGSASAFGFIDPAHVLRGAHLIPAFHYGRTSEFLGPSVACHFDADDHQDYRYYYVNHFVDRDMFMRYSSDAVGHRTGAQLSSVTTVDPPTEDANTNEMDVDDGPNEPEPASTEDEEPGSDEGDASGPESEIDSDEEEEEEEEEEAEGGAEEEENAVKDADEIAAGADETDDALVESAGYDEL
ncbi:hypothetical protein DFH06DRAFT_1341756 [Mycena polygramma]|nr:hypothetical protein DFH06DRAFT_1341756 [Mycena polygramma]